MRVDRRTLSLLALAACGSSSASGSMADGGATSTADAAVGPGDASAGGSADAGTAIGDAGSGGATIDGSVGGTPFGGASTALWIGAADDPATTVVYVFSRPVVCGELATPGWDARITNGTQVLEMKMFGVAPGTFQVVTTQTPAPGEAAVNYTLSSTTGTPSERVASGGTVMLASLTAGARAKGAFAVGFATSRLDGTFDAPFCAGGHEP